ncbi:MAG: hypothetical protein ACFE9V_20080 [Candidatus Hodarchaeota archaeon]
MNIVFEFIRYFLNIIVGILLVKWYERKKGWENRFKTSLLFILWWKTLMLFILIGINLFFDFFEVVFPQLFYELYFLYPILLIVVSFFTNIILGVYILKFVYKQITQESVVIILIIVIIEMILESILLYSILIPETLISSFNL